MSGGKLRTHGHWCLRHAPTTHTRSHFPVTQPSDTRAVGHQSCCISQFRGERRGPLSRKSRHDVLATVARCSQRNGMTANVSTGASHCGDVYKWRFWLLTLLFKLLFASTKMLVRSLFGLLAASLPLLTSAATSWKQVKLGGGGGFVSVTTRCKGFSTHVRTGVASSRSPVSSSLPKPRALPMQGKRSTQSPSTLIDQTPTGPTLVVFTS